MSVTSFSSGMYTQGSGSRSTILLKNLETALKEERMYGYKRTVCHAISSKCLVLNKALWIERSFGLFWHASSQSLESCLPTDLIILPRVLSVHRCLIAIPRVYPAHRTLIIIPNVLSASRCLSQQSQHLCPALYSAAHRLKFLLKECLPIPGSPWSLCRPGTPPACLPALLCCSWCPTSYLGKG